METAAGKREEGQGNIQVSDKTTPETQNTKAELGQLLSLIWDTVSLSSLWNVQGKMSSSKAPWSPQESSFRGGGTETTLRGFNPTQ